MITLDSDSSISYHFAGHVEDGGNSISDPHLGASQDGEREGAEMENAQ